MPRRCTICAHPDHTAIDEALLAGEAYRSIALRYATSAMAVYRHQQAHLPLRLRQARDTQEREESASLAASLHRLQGDAARITGRAEAKDDLRTALLGVQTQARLVELRQKLAEAEEIENRLEMLEAAIAKRRIA